MSDFFASDIITMPVIPFMRASGLGHSKVWEMISSGEIETITVGKRRLVVVDSYRRLVARKLAEPRQDARRNAAVPALGTKASAAA